MKVFLIGLDCAAPELIFDKWKTHLPNISQLMDSGIYGRLKSTIPPITVPAWTAMFTSKDPGELGIYGFRNRRDFSYEELFFANSKHVKEKTLWNYLSINRKTSILINIPQTFPPKPLRGVMVGCFLTPNKDVPFTYPECVKQELDDIADGNYIIDVKDFRTTHKEKLLAQIYEMTQKRFKVIKNFLLKKEWDFFAFVEMGTDRIHHGFWRFMDETHRLYEKGNPFEDAIFQYYKYIDSEIGEVFRLLPKDTYVLVVSDHGARTMLGGICINEWLLKEGYLTLKEVPTKQSALEPSMVDWTKTYAWAEGGYYGRVFLNVEKREPQGIIKPESYEQFRDKIKQGIESIGDEHGKAIGTTVFKPEEIYNKRNGIVPDLIVYFGNLAWRSAGSVGAGAIHIFENDTGPDDANHAQEGIFIMSQKGHIYKNPGIRQNLEIYDVTPTILNIFDINVPTDMIGKVIQ